MDDLLKRRMSAAQQASELEVGNVAYETMFQAKADTATPRFCELPINSLFPFRFGFSADTLPVSINHNAVSLHICAIW